MHRSMTPFQREWREAVSLGPMTDGVVRLGPGLPLAFTAEIHPVRFPVRQWLRLAAEPGAGVPWFEHA